MSTRGPQDVSLLRFLSVFDVQRPDVLAAHVVPEGHAQVGVGRGDGEAGQPGHLLLLVSVVSSFTWCAGVCQLHEDEVPWSTCREQQEARSQFELWVYSRDFICIFSGKRFQ